jgi:hypothetical protein
MPSAHAARLQQDRGAILVGMLAQDDAQPPLAHKSRQALLAVAQRQAAEVLAVELQKVVEGVQHGLADGAAPVFRTV